MICRECQGSGERDSGGTHPWGEAISLACDCHEIRGTVEIPAEVELEARHFGEQEFPSQDPEDHTTDVKQATVREDRHPAISRHSNELLTQVSRTAQVTSSTEDLDLLATLGTRSHIDDIYGRTLALFLSVKGDFNFVAHRQQPTTVKAGTWILFNDKHWHQLSRRSTEGRAVLLVTPARPIS